jgi:serine protease
MPVRVLGVNGGDGLDSDIADAVRWASGLTVAELPPPSRPADVLNLSFGGPTISFTLQRAFDEALAQGVLIIAAAGNGGVDAITYSPGGLDSVITVGASGKNGGRAGYSNYGSRVDLLAPGGDDELTDAGTADGILSTYRDEGTPGSPAAPPYTYSRLAGTSQAAPHVAAAAALSRAVWPALRQPALGALLAASADPSYRCSIAQGGCGAGLLDVEALLKLVQKQAGCGCAGDRVCLDGRTCVEPSQRHPLLYGDNTLYGGWCQLAAAGSRRPATGGPALWFLLAAAALLLAVRRRARREALLR